MATSNVQVKIILTGAHAGKTIKLGNLPYNFENGETTLIGPSDDVNLHARFIERNWQGYPEGHPKLKELQDGERSVQSSEEQNQEPSVQGDGESNGGGSAEGASDVGSDGEQSETGDTGVLPERDGHQSAPVNEKLVKAVKSLDSGSDDHWTNDGRPAMKAVEKFYGATDITRADVDAAIPGYTREVAKGE